MQFLLCFDYILVGLSLLVIKGIVFTHGFCFHLFPLSHMAKVHTLEYVARLFLCHVAPGLLSPLHFLRRFGKIYCACLGSYSEHGRVVCWESVNIQWPFQQLFAWPEAVLHVHLLLSIVFFFNVSFYSSFSVFRLMEGFVSFSFVVRVVWQMVQKEVPPLC